MKIAKQFREKNWGTDTADLEVYYKVIVINAVRYWQKAQKYNQMEQTTESRKRPTCNMVKVQKQFN